VSPEGATLEEATIASVRNWGEADFTDAEKAALHYTERLFIDHGNIDQELFDELLQHYTEEQIVELGWAVVSYLGFGRLIHSFGLRPA
jgi:alkylhydroperoxidase family enzyme